MSTYSRTVRSIPHRDALQTWDFIVELLTQGNDTTARKELRAVAGIASSLITEQGPKTAPITAICDGPRTRIYCTYDDDALDSSDANEDGLGFDPLKGDWSVSLPCPASDLDWVQAALKKHSSRITARDVSQGIATEEASTKTQAMTLDIEGLMKL